MTGEGALGRRLVAAQFALLALWLLSGPRIAPGMVGIVVQACGLAIAGWAFVVMISAQRRLFRIAPDPVGHTQLVTWGPYRWVRHPMYVSILLVVGGAWVGHSPAWGLLVPTALAVVLVVKLEYEERLLQGHFENYAAYRATSWRLLPGLY